MNKVSSDRIHNAAKFLSTPTAIAARGFLAPPLELALNILDCLDGEPRFPDAIAQLSGHSTETVRQVLRELEKGGYPLTYSPSRGWSIKRRRKR